MDLLSTLTPQAAKVARDILTYSRDLLLVNLRFLDASISQLKLSPVELIPTVSVDGEYIYYNPRHILSRFQQQKENVARDYLHMVFHCLFHHPFVNKTVHQGCWDLACDIAAESAITDLGLMVVQSEQAHRQEGTLKILAEHLKLLTAEKIYRYYLDQNLSDDELIEIRWDFYADDHSSWYAPAKGESSRQKGDAGEEESQQNAAEKGAAGQLGGSEGDEESEAEAAKQSYGSGEDSLVQKNQALMDLWKRISERAQVDLETTSRRWGDQKGGLRQGLNQLTREKYDYASFLQKFSVLGEVMQVNDDEFDLVFYTYGLKLYKNLPLIEPLEYKEVKRVKEFVIAIDTSGSVQGTIVQNFVQKTYNLLKQTENFFTRVNIHIIQCDAEIQEDIKITNAEEFEEYIQSMTLRGFGGTDFRPVFAYVDQLIENHEFENLKGLIYFTDGMGVYPAQKPEYEAAFVFLDDEFVNERTVPYWAIKLVLSSDDVME